MKKLTIEHVQYISHTLALETLSWNEPIPEFTTRAPHILESCISTPFQSVQGNDLYPTLYKKAAILFYLLIKNHPFQNGNKRTAVTTLIVFLYLNKKWLTVDQNDLYHFARWVADSPANLKDELLEAIESFIKKHSKPVKK